VQVLRIASVVGASLLAGACTEVIASGSRNAATYGAPQGPVSDGPTTAAPTLPPPTEVAAGTDEPATPRAASAPSSTTSVPATTTTTTEPRLAVHDPACVVEVQPGDSLGAIVTSRADEIVTSATLRAENALADELIVPGQLLDVCIDNGLDDISGEQRLERNAAVIEAETVAAVMAQQAKLNELLVPLGFPEMPVDGISGPVTRRGLCATRLALGLPVNRSDMEPGSVEEQFLLATTALPMPPNVATDGRWIFIDLTCQVLLTGEGFDRLVHVFPTSTGEAGYETRLQERVRAFRFNPALANGGWHNSSTYPVEADNPLNGNMYKPLYFDRGQAIHGANNVPTSPQSKGCARLRPSHQDALVSWLGLADLGGPTGSRDRINATVTVRGAYELG
jgi:hypothetical protein